MEVSKPTWMCRKRRDWQRMGGTGELITHYSLTCQHAKCYCKIRLGSTHVKGDVHPKMKYQWYWASHLWKVWWNFVVHKTFLEPHNKLQKAHGYICISRDLVYTKLYGAQFFSSIFSCFQTSPIYISSSCCCCSVRHECIFISGWTWTQMGWYYTLKKVSCEH